MARSALRLASSAASVAEPLVEPLVKRLAPGRIVELSGAACQPGARTTTAVAIVRAAQMQGETVAWIQPTGGALFPPDLSESGIDLDALVVVHIPACMHHGQASGLVAAAELLLRSGAWGLVVVDLCHGAPPGPAEAWQGRLLGLCRQHESRLVLLTDKPAHVASLGALVGLRVEPRRRRLRSGRFAVTHEVLKNKTGTTTTTDDLYRGPWGFT